MRPTFRQDLVTLLLSIILVAGAQAAEQDAEVEYLLEFVAISDCEFLRNGSAHNAADAADHLRMKYSRGKRYVDDAEDFIDRLASESSWSGKPYQVECAGSLQLSREWLQEALADYRQRQLSDGATATP